MPRQYLITALTLALSFQLGLGPDAWAARKSATKRPAVITPPSANDEADYMDDIDSAREDEGIPDDSALRDPLPIGRSRPRSNHIGWRSRRSAGMWWNSYSVTVNGVESSAGGLPSLFINGGSDYTFDLVYLGYDAELMTPQILWKGIGLGIFYFFCFFLSGGSCTANPSFATAPQDAGYGGLGAHFGYHFAPLPVRGFIGPDIGLFQNAMTPYLYSTLFLKVGAGWDFADLWALEFMIRRSLIMSEWKLSTPSTGISNSNQWLLTLGITSTF